MSLKKKFKTDTTAANEGVWFDYEDAPNEDGTVPGFKLARKSQQNKAYSKAMRDFTKEHTSEDGVTDFADLSEDQAQAVELDVFVNSLLVEWRNFQPNDDGKAMDFSPANAKKIFGDPDWTDLYRDLARKCGQATAYRTAQLKAEAKNS